MAVKVTIRRESPTLRSVADEYPDATDFHIQDGHLVATRTDDNYNRISVATYAPGQWLYAAVAE